MCLNASFSMLRASVEKNRSELESSALAYRQAMDRVGESAAFAAPVFRLRAVAFGV